MRDTSGRIDDAVPASARGPGVRRHLRVREPHLPQLSELGIEVRRPGALGTGADDCLFRTSDSRRWDVRFQRQRPITQYNPGDASYLGRTESYQDPRVTTIEGHGALEFLYSLSGSRPGCYIAVDAAPGATVLAGYSDNSAQYPDRPVAGRAESCAMASRVASLVIGNLGNRPPR